MSDQLFPVVPRPVGSITIPTVNARELHTFLENKDKFTTWIKDRIDQFGFVENQDFVSFSENSEKPRGGRPSIEYALTLSMGKELSMVERNAKGKQARQYFLECERIAKDPMALLNDPATLKALLLSNLQQVEEQKHQIEQRDKLIAVTAPKAAALDKIALSDGSFCISHIAKVLEFLKVKDCFAWLHGLHWIFRRNGEWIAHQDKVRDGLMEVKTFTYTSTDGSSRAKEQSVVTAKGLAKLALLLEKSPPQLPLLQGGAR